MKKQNTVTNVKGLVEYASNIVQRNVTTICFLKRAKKKKREECRQIDHRLYMNISYTYAHIFMRKKKRNIFLAMIPRLGLIKMGSSYACFIQT